MADLTAVPGEPKPARMFTKENASEMARRGAEARKRNAEARKDEAAALRILIDAKIAKLPPRDQMKDLAGSIVMQVLVDVVTGKLKPKSTTEAMSIARACYEITRLEGDQATTISQTVTKEQAQQQLNELRRRANDNLKGVGA